MAESNSSLAHGSLSNVTNSTDVTVVPTFDPAVQKAVDILLMILMALVMMSLGCTIKPEEIKQQLNRPIGMGIAMISQFIIYPATMFGLAHALNPDKWDAIGMILLGTCPGGAISNIITFWAGGNVALSVSMTAVSTGIGTGMMPLNLWIHSKSWTDQSTTVPYVNIIITLILIMVPVPIGMIISWKFPRAGIWIAKIGSVLGFLIIVGVIALTSYQYPEMFQSSWQVMFAAAIMPSLGLCLGFLASSVICFTSDIRKAIAIEISAQNVSLCLTLIVISFPKDIFFHIMMFPLLFGMFSVATLVLFAASCRIVSFLAILTQERKQKERMQPLHELHNLIET